ncbi:hypothetical protein BEWA_023610 [Theileria equi strain WA]|uniref:Uncharacterized protein n=1 Tax=Theileria equi strain WA TaxID=1537102 RepID=L0AV75_THEEQ|nr:hypothetical protein BEWA_023610 [Theileria equi strain WA]AFZ79512.1 hypothetical protein BEWA_023610 [Theileria equi strain WA]|eukprot:XP_004829178.1 hypothetical protein BEWA_023610 [Theileria equi strain WA]
MADNERDNFLRELKKSVFDSHPGVEDQISGAFSAHDVVGDGFLPFSVVEALLRHYFTQSGLVEYIYPFLDSNDHLDTAVLAPFLQGTQLESLDEDTLLSCEDMKTLATLWLKKISEAYSQDALAGRKNAFNCVVSPPSQRQEPCSVLAPSDEFLDQDVEVVGPSPQEIVDSYVNSIMQEVQRNKSAGIVCYAYPAALTPNGACTSAGAVLPHRRPRAKREKTRLLFGCC